jgi:hypothetical protein
MGVKVSPGGTVALGAGTATGSAPSTLTGATPIAATAAANTAVVVTLAALPGVSYRLDALSVGYAVAVAGGQVTVTFGGVTVLQLPITAIGPVTIPLPDGGLQTAVNQAIVITLAAGGATSIGFVNAATFTGP